MDFRAMLSASRTYVSAYRRFDEKSEPAPWAPALTDEEQAAFDKAQEQMMDRLMGVGKK